MDEWCQKFERLCQIAKSIAHIAYVHMFTDFSTSILTFSEQLKTSENMITYGFFLTLFGSALTETVRSLIVIALLVRLGGMEISILSSKANDHFKASKLITAETVENIANQDRSVYKKATIKYA